MNASDSQIDIENLTESQLAALQAHSGAHGEFIEDGMVEGGVEGEEMEDDDVIDVDNPEDLAKKGLRRI